MALPSDLIDLLAEFAASQAEYLLVGGQAVALHGCPRFTKDADIWVRDEGANLARVESALRNFGAPSETIGALAGAAPLDVVWMGAPPARIDLMKGVPGGDFDDAWSSRKVFDVEGTSVSTVGLQQLIHLKRASGRAQDLVDVTNLEKQLTDPGPA